MKRRGQRGLSLGIHRADQPTTFSENNFALDDLVGRLAQLRTTSLCSKYGLTAPTDRTCPILATVAATNCARLVNVSDSRPQTARLTDERLWQFTNRDVAELDWVVVSGESEVSGCAVFAGVRFARHVLGHFAKVRI